MLSYIGNYFAVLYEHGYVASFQNQFSLREKVNQIRTAKTIFSLLILSISVSLRWYRETSIAH